MSGEGRVPPHDLLDFALDLVGEAGRLTERYFRSAGLDIETKADGTPVTIAEEFLPENANLSDCVGFAQRPGCGAEVNHDLDAA